MKPQLTTRAWISQELETILSKLSKQQGKERVYLSAKVKELKYK